MELVIKKRIAELNRADWESVYPPVVENYDFFVALDDAKVEPFSFYYVIAYEGKKPIAATTFFLVEYSLEMTVQGPLRTVLVAIKKVFPRLLSARTLICGCLGGRGHVGLGGGDHRAALNAIVEAMEKIAHEERIALLVFKDFDHTFDGPLAPLTESGFYRWEGLPTTDMEFTFKDWEGYLGTLSSATRYDLRRKFRRLDKEKPLSFEVCEALTPEDLDAAYELYLQTVQKHELGFEIMPKAFFKRIAETMPHATKFFLWRREGRIAAFAFCLVVGDYFLDYYLGFDYSLLDRYPLFFIRFRDLLLWSLPRGIKRYEMGWTGYEPKRRLGFSLVPLYTYIKHRGRLVNRFVEGVCRLIRFENFDPALRAMKKRDETKRPNA